MEKSYSLRNVRKVFGPDGNIVSAAIYLGHRRIGAVHDDITTGTAHFEFDLFTDRIVFEQHVQSWWEGARQDIASVADSASNEPAFVPSLQAKMRYWMQAAMNDSASAKRSRRAA